MFLVWVVFTFLLWLSLDCYCYISEWVGLTFRLTGCKDWHEYSRRAVVWGLTPQSGICCSRALVPGLSFMELIGWCPGVV